MHENIIVFYKTLYKILSINVILFQLNVDFYYTSTAALHFQSVVKLVWLSLYNIYWCWGSQLPITD